MWNRWLQIWDSFGVWWTMPATRGQVWLLWATIVVTSYTAITKMGTMASRLYHFIKKGEQVIDWILKVVERYEDPNEVIRKLDKVNGHDKPKGKEAGND